MHFRRITWPCSWLEPADIEAVGKTLAERTGKVAARRNVCRGFEAENMVVASTLTQRSRDR